MMRGILIISLILNVILLILCLYAMNDLHAARSQLKVANRRLDAAQTFLGNQMPAMPRLNEEVHLSPNVYLSLNEDGNGIVYIDGQIVFPLADEKPFYSWTSGKSCVAVMYNARAGDDKAPNTKVAIIDGRRKEILRGYRGDSLTSKWRELTGEELPASFVAK